MDNIYGEIFDGDGNMERIQYQFMLFKRHEFVKKVERRKKGRLNPKNFSKDLLGLKIYKKLTWNPSRNESKFNISL